MNRCEEFDVGSAATVWVNTKSGSIDVRTTDTRRCTVTLDGPDADAWDVKQLGDSISVSPPGGGWRTRSVRVLVETPTGTDVDIGSASADVTLTGELGVTRVKTASGDVRVGTVDRLDVATASGDARAGSVVTSATCNTSSGDVEIGHVGGRVAISTASGDVRVSNAFDDLEIGSASGDIRVDHFGGSDLAVKSIAGDVLVGLPAGIRVEPDISTLSGRTDLPAPAAPAPSGDRRVVRVGIRTVSGDIVIRRVEPV